MKLPRDLSGEQLARVLCRDWDYRQVHQVGSHIILQTDEPGSQRIAVPAHKSLRIGTLNGILRCVASHKRVAREDILDCL
jgi:predicted RNA binding protein YcfA (HicA-like mRNA interferase family)